MFDNAFVLRLNGKVTAASGHNSKANTERAQPGDKKTAIVMHHSTLRVLQKCVSNTSQFCKTKPKRPTKPYFFAIK